mmetsp:Transcript_16191/g.24550  ORF Transcript_16191/g.24550 Transcript_16191/m.24550 type:complete len:87 (-) Transcript_16191:84-344(-)
MNLKMAVSYQIAPVCGGQIHTKLFLKMLVYGLCHDRHTFLSQVSCTIILSSVGCRISLYIPLLHLVSLLDLMSKVELVGGERGTVL